VPPGHCAPRSGSSLRPWCPGTLRSVGALNLVVAKDDILGMDLATFFGLLISIIALVLSLLVPAAWLRRLLLVFCSIALLEFLLLLVSMPLWVRVVVAVVLFAAGVGWVVWATRKDNATGPQHTEKIHGVLDSLGTALRDERPSNLENSDAAIITSHFPGIEKQAKAWDEAVKGVTDYKQRLRDSVGSKLRDLHADEPPYNFDVIRDGLCAITEARIADEADSSQSFPPMTGFPDENPIFTSVDIDTIPIVSLAFNQAAGATGYLVRLERGADPAGAAQFDERYAKPIYDLLREMQTWGSTIVLNQNRHKLQKFPRAALESAVKKKRDKAYYQRVQGCPGCKKQ
jgi:hypothetical protein